MYTVDITLFSLLNLCVNLINDTSLLLFPARQVPQDTKKMNYAARREFYSAIIMPFLQSSYDIFALDGSEAGGRVDVDVSVFLGGFAEFADGEGG